MHTHGLYRSFYGIGYCRKRVSHLHSRVQPIRQSYPNDLTCEQLGLEQSGIPVSIHFLLQGLGEVGTSRTKDRSSYLLGQ